MKLLDRLKNKRFAAFITIFKKQMTEAEVGNNAVVVSYYLLLSIFPLIIVIANILPLLQIDPQTILPYVKEIFPAEIYKFLRPALISLFTQGSGGLLSVSALGAVWSASQGVNALQKAMNQAYGVEARGNAVLVRLVSVGLVGLLMLAIFGAALVLSIGQVILEAIQPIINLSTDFVDLFLTLRWPVVLVILFAVMAVIYYVLPNAKPTVRSVLPGTFFATVGWMLLSQLFGIYAQYFARRVGGYQIIGSFIVLMLWLNFAATIIILGGVLNAVLAEFHSGKELATKDGMISRFDKRIKEAVKKRFSKK